MLKRTWIIILLLCPQKQGLNGGQWARLEAAAHALAGSHGRVWIFTGPAFASGAPTRTMGPDSGRRTQALLQSHPVRAY